MHKNELDVIFEDNHLLVVSKPSGLLTQPSGTEQDSLEKIAKEWIKTKYQKPGNVFLEAVHRLDKPASGIVVFGKTSKAVSRLNASIRDKLTKKIYNALVEGFPPAHEDVLEHYVIHDEYRAQIVPSNHFDAKLARLSYKTIEKYKNATLLEVELDTGRYHQIRLQLSAIGCPILGDSKYGSHRKFGFDAIALHHILLKIPHPVTHALMTFEAPLPSDYFNNFN